MTTTDPGGRPARSIRCLFGQHQWTLTDKTVIPPSPFMLSEGPTEAQGSIAAAVVQFRSRHALGYVVLVFTCPCGDYRVEEH